MDAARWAFNWALGKKIEDVRAATEGQKLKIRSGKTLDGELRALKDSDEAYTWLNEIASHVRQAAIAQVDAAVKNFFGMLKRNKTAGIKNHRKRSWRKRLAKRPETSSLELMQGFPEFKSRKRGDSIGIRHYSYRISERAVRIARVDGAIKLKESGYLPAGCYNEGDGIRLLGLTISTRAGRWFASVQVEQEVGDAEPPDDLPVKAVHFGVRVHAATSDGKRYENPRALMRLERKLKRLQRTVSRRHKDSKRCEKARAVLANLHYKIACTRGDAIHKMTRDLTRDPSAIIVEMWDVQGMLTQDKPSKLKARIADASMSEAKRQLVYKADWYGSTLSEAERYFVSSRRCSVCGETNDKNSGRIMFTCQHCGVVIEREDNAVANLEWLAASHADTKNARGEESSESA